MKALLVTIKEMIKVGILFSVFACLFYFSFYWLNEQYTNYQKYDQPNDSVIKVFHLLEKSDSYVSRLHYFFQNGE